MTLIDKIAATFSEEGRWKVTYSYLSKTLTDTTVDFSITYWHDDNEYAASWLTASEAKQLFELYEMVQYTEQRNELMKKYENI